MKIKNRGASSNPPGRFEKELRETFDDGWNLNTENSENGESDEEDFQSSTLETTLLLDKAKTVITRNDSPDIGFEQSINPYRGCEHGCIYCYARPSHAYMNLSPGLDFETKIFYKVNAANLLENELRKPKYTCKPIMLGSNTDPYQPLESKLQVTRSLLEVLHRTRHPVAVITKSSMIERDIDLLADMAKQGLAKVAISVTTLSNSIKQSLEPRTSAPKARLNVMQRLTAAGIPVRVMVAPIIPLITCVEMEKILQLAAQAGAQHASYTLVRLPYEVKDLFKEWLAKHFPERAAHVMNIIRQMRNGKEYDASFGKRMRGEGEYANLLAARFQLACKRFKLNAQPAAILNTALFKLPKPMNNQLSLWDESA